MYYGTCVLLIIRSGNVTQACNIAGLRFASLLGAYNEGMKSRADPGFTLGRGGGGQQIT